MPPGPHGSTGFPGFQYGLFALLDRGLVPAARRGVPLRGGPTGRVSPVVVTGRGGAARGNARGRGGADDAAPAPFRLPLPSLWAPSSRPRADRPQGSTSAMVGPRSSMGSAPRGPGPRSTAARGRPRRRQRRRSRSTPWAGGRVEVPPVDPQRQVGDQAQVLVPQVGPGGPAVEAGLHPAADRGLAYTAAALVAVEADVPLAGCTPGHHLDVWFGPVRSALRTPDLGPA